MTIRDLDDKLDAVVGFSSIGGAVVLTQTVEYALRATCYLAFESPEPRTTSQIAEATKVPPAYLSKVLQSLNRAGVVHSQRGIGGGMSLARPAEALTILEVVNAVDPIERIVTCPLGLATHGVRLCALHRRLDNAIAMVQDAFANTTLAEILEEQNPSVPLCNLVSKPPNDSAERASSKG